MTSLTQTGPADGGDGQARRTHRAAVGAGGLRGAKGPTRLLAGLVVLLAAGLLAVAALTAYFAVEHGDQSAVDSGSQQALGAATREIVTVTSYDYRHLAADRKAAAGALTPAFGQKYVTVLRNDAEGARRYHTVVKSSVVKAAVERYGASSDVIMVFLDRSRTGTARPGTHARGYRLLVTMQRTGGRWLISDIVAD